VSGFARTGQYATKKKNAPAAKTAELQGMTPEPGLACQLRPVVHAVFTKLGCQQTTRGFILPAPAGGSTSQPGPVYF